MTIAPHTDEQAASGRADLARTDANRVATLVQIARDGHNEARDHGDDAERLQHASFVLYDRIASKPGDRRTRLDRALHGADGSLDEEALLEYLDLTGREGFSARQALQKILDRRTLPEFDGGQTISDRLHGLAYTWEREDRAQEAPAATRPALPAGAAPSTGGPLPKRVPGQRLGPQPSQPPMFPPAPEPTAAETTDQMILRHVGDGVYSPEDGVRMLKGDRAAATSPSANDSFAAAALPQARSISDTVTMRADAVLAELAQDDVFEPAPVEPRPFAPAAVEASRATAGDARAASAERPHLELTDTAE